MNENEHNQHQGNDHILVHHEHKPYWKNIHHSWIFWVFLLLMLGGIIYYIISVDFALAPSNQLKQSSENKR